MMRRNTNAAWFTSPVEGFDRLIWRKGKHHAAEGRMALQLAPGQQPVEHVEKPAQTMNLKSCLCQHSPELRQSQDWTRSIATK
jgi:hypothetical protein